MLIAQIGRAGPEKELSVAAEPCCNDDDQNSWLGLACSTFMTIGSTGGRPGGRLAATTSLYPWKFISREPLYVCHK